MGSVGGCYDNAVIQSFWSRLQVELLDRKRWKTRLELANAIFEYLERYSTTVSAATQRSACSPPSSSKLDTPAPGSRPSSEP
jgi:transposase InsO family protein